MVDKIAKPLELVYGKKRLLIYKITQMAYISLNLVLAKNQKLER